MGPLFIRFRTKMQESKTSQTRVAFALLCGLAVCCGVMYATADGAEVVHEAIVADKPLDGEPNSIGSTDVAKSEIIYTQTPRTLTSKDGAEGRERLLDFFNHKDIDRAIAVGEARMKQVQETAM